MPSVFKMLQTPELIKNFNELAKKELAKHGATDDITKLPAQRRNQLELIETMIDSHASNREITGAMLYVKAQIAKEYSDSAKNSYSATIYNWWFKPTNSVVYSEMDKIRWVR